MSASPDRHTSPFRKSLRTVALFEAAKGVAVIVAGFGLLALIHRNAQEVAEELVRHLHMNPARHLPHIFLDLAGSLTDARLWRLALLALVYALVRFVESWGLWRARRWAEWFGIISGGIYIPFEVQSLMVSVNPVKVILLLGNLLVVGCLVTIRWREDRDASRA